MVDLKQIQCFVACVQTGSFSKAAELLFTTQPSVSKIIKAMEEQMKVPLFERYAKGISLTPEGERIYHYAKKVLENLEKMENTEFTKRKEQLLISCNPSSWFADMFVEFFHGHEQEDICYQVYSAGTREIVRRVQERMDDIGFVYVMKNQLSAFQYYIGRNYLNFEPLLQTDAMIYRGKHLHSEKEKDTEGVNLSEIRLIQRFPNEFSPENYWEILDKEGHSFSDAEAVVTTNSDYIMNRLLQTSDLVNIGGAYLSKGQATENAVRLSDGEDGQILYGYVFRRGEELSECVSAFVDFLKDKLNALQRK